jgi:hypothetical protein
VLLPESAGDCLSAKLRRGNEHSAEDWYELLLPKIERLQTKRRQGLCRLTQPLPNRVVSTAGKRTMGKLVI